MPINLVVTRGFGTGTLAGTVPAVSLRGYTSAAVPIFLSPFDLHAFDARITAINAFDVSVTDSNAEED